MQVLSSPHCLWIVYYFLKETLHDVPRFRPFCFIFVPLSKLHLSPLSCSRQLDRHEKVGMTGLVWNVTVVGSLGGLAKENYKMGHHPQGDLFFLSILLVMQVRPPKLSYCWSCDSDPSLTFPPLACH